jgi:two-component system cell cycle response regulator
MFRASAKTKATPVFGMCVKTASEEQLRAQQVGFTGVVTKPLDPDELKSKICRSLNLDTSYKYFQQRDGVLVLSLPATLTPNVANEISLQLRPKVAEAVDSGLGKMVVDMGQLRVADVNLVRLGISAIQLCGELSLKHRLIGSSLVQQECRNYEETKDWQFVASFEEAVAALNDPMAVAA